MLFLFTVDTLGSEKLLDLVNTLIQVLVVQLEKPQSVQMLPLETLTPWILLHRMLSHEEQLQKQAEAKQEAAGEGECKENGSGFQVNGIVISIVSCFSSLLKVR